MRCPAAARRRLLFCQKLGGLAHPVHPPFTPLRGLYQYIVIKGGQDIIKRGTHLACFPSKRAGSRATSPYLSQVMSIQAKSNQARLIQFNSSRAELAFLDISACMIWYVKVFAWLAKCSLIFILISLFNLDRFTFKVSRSRNKIVEPYLLPKNERTIFFSILMTRKYLKLEFRPDDSEILETWNRNSSFKYFRVVRIEKQIRPFVFWEKLRLDNFVSRSTDL